MRLVLLPIEILAREHDARLLVASELIKRGFNVLMGMDKHFNGNTGNFFNSGLLDKSCSSIMGANRIIPLRKNNGYTIVSDEEGVNDISANRENYLRRMDGQTMMAIDKYLFWGQHDKGIMLDKFSSLLSTKGIVAGNTRGDVIQNKLNHDLSMNIKKNMGDKTILVVDNFGPLSRAEGEIFLPKYAGETEAMYRERYDNFQKKQSERTDERKNLIELINQIAQKTDYNIVLRPHPRSSRTFWKEKVVIPGRVLINDDYSGEVWINATEGLISCGCSLGLEAIASFKNSVDYSQTHISKRSVSFQISRHAEDLESTMHEIETRDNSQLIDGYKKLKYYWSRDKRTSELIADLFDANIVESKISEKIKFIKNIEEVTDQRKWTKNGQKNFYERSLYVLSRLLPANSFNCKQVTNALIMISPR